MPSTASNSGAQEASSPRTAGNCWSRRDFSSHGPRTSYPAQQGLRQPGTGRGSAGAVGLAGDWVSLASGPWTVWLAVNKDGRFPDVDRHIPRLDGATARCRFSPADAGFLGETLSRLPCDNEFNCRQAVQDELAREQQAEGPRRPTATRIASRPNGNGQANGNGNSRSNGRKATASQVGPSIDCQSPGPRPGRRPCTSVTASTIAEDLASARPARLIDS